MFIVFRNQFQVKFMTVAKWSRKKKESLEKMLLIYSPRQIKNTKGPFWFCVVYLVFGFFIFGFGPSVSLETCWGCGIGFEDDRKLRFRSLASSSWRVLDARAVEREASLVGATRESFCLIFSEASLLRNSLTSLLFSFWPFKLNQKYFC